MVSPSRTRANASLGTFSKQATPVCLPGSQQVVGFVEGDFFRKTITGSKHILRRPRAIGFDVTTLDDAENLGASHVAVTDRETGRIYRAPIETIRRHGLFVARGFGRQVALELKHFSIDGEAPENDGRSPNQVCKEKQLSLFGD